MTNFQYKESENRLSLDKKVELIQEYIKRKQPLEIVYLKANNEKSRRVVVPTTVETMSYMNKEFLGMKGLCQKRQEERVFRVDRILEIKEEDHLPVKKATSF